MLFSLESEGVSAPRLTEQPLAARMRPRSFEEYAGQQHIIGPGKLLRRAIEADTFSSIILYGPPGVGKTTLAELIALLTASSFLRRSAVTSTVADIRKAIAEAVELRRYNNRKTILFIDEIHRFNKAQQDVLLPHVEDGSIRLIGATTENPFFYIVGPLVSRSQVFHLEPLSENDICGILRRACTDERGFAGQDVQIHDDALAFLAQASEGDGRKALTSLETAVLAAGPAAGVRIDLAAAEETLLRKAVTYGEDGHYDTISAFIKSMRGSDPDAAVYWLAKMLSAGEDVRFIARRLVIFASEDVGNADPRALTLAVTTMQAVQMIGMPEARIILSQATTYCATCPKSNASLTAIDRAMSDVAGNRVQPVPRHLRDAHYQGSSRLGHGKGYEYPHDHPNHFVPQTYLEIPVTYYEPADIGYEARIRERLKFWSDQRAQAVHGNEQG